MLSNSSGYESSRDFIQRLWRERGIPQEQLDCEARLARIFSLLLQTGHKCEEITDEWNELKPEEILEKYGYLDRVDRV